MSTSYYTSKPMTIAEVVKITGWEYHVGGQGQQMLTDGYNYIEWDTFEYDGSTWCSFEHWGANDVTDFEIKMDDRLLSEHDDAFWDLPWNEIHEEDDQ